MARYPLHPRLSRLMVEARRRGVARDGCAVAALLSAGDRLPARAPHASRSDLLVLLEAEWSAYAVRLFRQLGGAGGAGTRTTNTTQTLPHGRDSDWRYDRGSDHRREGSDHRREASDQRHEGSDHRREGSD